MHPTLPRAASSLRGTISIALVFTAYVAVVFGFGFYLFALVVTKMRQDWGFEYATIGVITGSAQLAYLGAALLCPRLANRFGGGSVIVVAVFAASGLLLLLGAVQNVVQAGLVLTGLGAAAAFMVVPTVGVISRIVPFAYRSRVNGLVSSGTAYGQFVNGILATSLLTDYGWRVVWIVIGSLALAVASSGFVLLCLFAPGVFERDANHQINDREAPAERRTLLNRQNGMIWTLLALSGLTCGPWQNYLSSLLLDERMLPVTTIGPLWSIIGAVGLFSGFLAGLAADRLGVRIVLAAAYLVLAGAALLVVVHAEAWQLQLAAVCFGLSFYAVYGLIPAYITKTVAPRSATMVFAVANVFLGSGTTLGNVLGGTMPTLFGSLQNVFVTATATACLGAALTMALHDERRTQVGA